VTPELFVALEAHVREVMRGREPSHDFLHVKRVLANVSAIAAEEKACDADVAKTAALLHELVTFKKNDPRSATAGDVCAEAARALLVARGESAEMAARVADVIADHAFSKGAAPRTIESAVLQDADRLDAIGAVGVARCFATCADMGGAFYAEDDPMCTAREPNDKAYAVDHFRRKLLVLEERMHTNAAKKLAKERSAFLRVYLEQLEKEIG
jgi:uncharacterized protein